MLKFIYHRDRRYVFSEVVLKKLLVYVKANIDFISRFLEEKLPQVKMIYPEGTYLVWLDFRELHLSQQELNERLLNDCGLWLNDGCAFGECGSGFMRLNAASPASVIQNAMFLMEKNLLKK